MVKIVSVRLWMRLGWKIRIVQPEVMKHAAHLLQNDSETFISQILCQTKTSIQIKPSPVNNREVKRYWQNSNKKLRENCVRTCETSYHMHISYNTEPKQRPCHWTKQEIRAVKSIFSQWQQTSLHSTDGRAVYGQFNRLHVQMRCTASSL